MKAAPLHRSALRLLFEQPLHRLSGPTAPAPLRSSPKNLDQSRFASHPSFVRFRSCEGSGAGGGRPRRALKLKENVFRSLPRPSSASSRRGSTRAGIEDSRTAPSYKRSTSLALPPRWILYSRINSQAPRHWVLLVLFGGRHAKRFATISSVNWVCRIGGEFILGCPLGAESRTTVAAFQYWRRGVPVTKLFAERSNKCEFDICCRAHKITNSEQLK